MNKPKILSIAVFVVLLASCSSEKNIYRPIRNYQPDDQALFDSILKLDSAFFGAYNTCAVNLETYASF